MYLRIRGRSFTEHLFREIEAITDHALLQVESVKYDAHDGSVSMLMDRFRLSRAGRNFMRRWRYKRDFDQRIRSSIVVRNVTSFEVEENILDSDCTEIMIMYGITVRSDHIILTSAEETSGVNWYSFDIGINVVDVELMDM